MADRRHWGTNAGGGSDSSTGVAPAEVSDDVDPSVLQLSPSERDQRGIGDDEVRDAFIAVARRGTADQKDLRGTTLPALSLDHLTVAGADRHPLDLRGATIESLSAVNARLGLPIRLDGATVGDLTVDEADLAEPLLADDLTVTGSISAFEADFGGDVMFADATFEGPVDLDEATFDNDVSFEGVTVTEPFTANAAEFYADSNRFEDDTSFTGATFEAAADFRQTDFGYARLDGVTFAAAAVFRECQFTGDVEFTDVTFEAMADFDEVRFDGDTSFLDAVFSAAATFRGATFHGAKRVHEDDVTFGGATFAGDADFTRAQFRYACFEAVDFDAGVCFEAAAFDADADFPDVRFAGEANFDEARFDGDTSFAGVTFRADATFRGATFRGAARVLEDDVTFVDATFAGDADFTRASFRYASFETVTFAGDTRFQEAVFDADADFPDARFAGQADFDEARFHEDADFSATTFEDRCVFRGAEFTGGANFLKDDLTFEGAHFGTDADFHNAEFTSANFIDTDFGGAIDFSGAVFDERVAFEATEVDSDVFVDFTRAKIRSGEIAQPDDDWVRYDLTLASLGDVTLSSPTETGHRRLLDYFRFCRTEFTEFDGHEFTFSEHRAYLDRNSWAIHEFHEPPDADPDYALAMTPEVVEATYLKAKQSASAVGDIKVAGEFRVKRQQYSRAQNLAVVRDDTVPLWTRAKNLGRAAENYFLGITCGHGMRPIRIGASFLLAPLLYVPLYAFGGGPFRTAAGQLSPGELFTPEGAATLFDIARFSYISYTTIGYGFLGPEGRAAEVLAASEAYLSVVLSALLVYALVKRSEM